MGTTKEERQNIYKEITIPISLLKNRPKENEFISSKYRKIINNNKELYSQIIIQERTLEEIP